MFLLEEVVLGRGTIVGTGAGRRPIVRESSGSTPERVATAYDLLPARVVEVTVDVSPLKRTHVPGPLADSLPGAGAE